MQEGYSPKISCKLIELPMKEYLLSKAFRGSYIRSISTKPTQITIKPHRVETPTRLNLRQSIRPNRILNTPLSKKRSYKPKSRLGQRLKLDETLQIYKSQIPLETPTSFSYSTRLQKNPKLV